MATAEVSAAVSASATAGVVRAAPVKCGDWIRATPTTPQPAASHTAGDGRTPSSGQDSSATQIGKVLVRVRTSEVGSWARAQNVQSRLALLAKLRSHRARGPRKTRPAPHARAIPAASTNASAARARATTRQSQVSLRRWASWLIQAVKKHPHIIHRYGATDRVRAAAMCHLLASVLVGAGRDGSSRRTPGRPGSL